MSDRMTNRISRDASPDATSELAQQRFRELVESVGVKRYAQSLGVTPRQVNRILSGAQPNPVERIIHCLESAEPEVGDRVLDYICQEMGGHFVRHEGLDETVVNAVKECAEAIAAISDGEVTDDDAREVREAISALTGIIIARRREKKKQQKLAQRNASASSNNSSPTRREKPAPTDRINRGSP
ncbi:MAG: hypothetical protein EA377_01180 [Phycisphaerales bacterium]|nr:MAG: hypothetical protein EA377_01180 [Phycisphaerales bacterium]